MNSRPTLRMRAFWAGPSAAFTLIELLVVISIVAILASLLLPAVNMVKQTSRQAVCSSNQRQMMIGIFMYMDDNRKYMPHPFVTDSGLCWQGGPLRDYISDSRLPDDDYCKGKGIIGCPSHANDFITWINPPDLYTQRFASYMLNGSLAGEFPSWGEFRLSQVERYSEKIFMMDAVNGWCISFGSPSYMTPASRGGFIHMGKANCAFLDGHVASRKNDITAADMDRTP